MISGANAAFVLATIRHEGRGHAERLENTALDQRRDRHAIALLQHQLQQDIAGMAVDALLARLLSLLGRPGVEHRDELIAAEGLVRPGRMIGRQQQPRCMVDELADRDAADIVPVQLGQILADGIVQPQLAALGAERDQCRFEQLAQRGEVEQRVRGDRPLGRSVGETVVEQGDPTAGIDRRGKAARIGRRRGRRQFRRHDVPDLRIHVGISPRRRQHASGNGEQDGRDPGEEPLSQEPLSHAERIQDDGAM